MWKILDNLAVLAALILGVFKLIYGDQLGGLLWIIISALWEIKCSLDWGNPWDE